MSAQPQRRRVVVFPWPEQGHINPALAITHSLANAGLCVTFLHTQRSLALLQQQAGPVDAHIPNVIVEVVSDNTEEATQESLQHLLSKMQPPPSCLIIDSYFLWSQHVTTRLRLPTVLIWPGSAYAFSIGLHIPDLISRGFLPITHPDCMEKVVDFIPGLTPFQMKDLRPTLTVPDLDKPVLKFFTSLFENIKKAQRMLAHTMYELESTAIEALKEVAGIALEPIGPLITSSRHSLHPEDSACLSWLNTQKNASVLYIAFGSTAIVKEDALLELAYGIEASKQPFLWVVRPQKDVQTPIEEMLPKGLISLANEGKGLITTWAPQTEVLSHPSVGAFLSHCGWNSTLESLQLGVPMLCFPQSKDQPVNAKCVVHDWKASLSLQQESNEDKLIERAHVEKMVRAMMIGDEGSEARRGAMQWAKRAKKALLGSSKENLQRLVDDIKLHRLVSNHQHSKIDSDLARRDVMGYSNE